jgi:surfeit locus 1 family protein
MAGPERRPAIWPALAALVGIVVGCALGVWQLGRANEKAEVKARFESHAADAPIHISSAELAVSDVELRHIEARGIFDTRHVIYIDNRIHHGNAGYHVVMPLRLGNGERYVLVNRGWIARLPDRTQLPSVRTPSEAVTVSGIAVVPGKRIFELSKDVVEGAIWQNLTIERYRKARPLDIQPFMIRQDNEAGDGLVREREAPDFGIDRHYGYAFQWFALAATLLVFYAATRYRRKNKPRA